jgi:1-acyl-sn-glycerol-3-phosphate acyltransferase
MQPKPTATDKQIKRDGRLLLQLMKAIAKVRMPSGIDVDPDRSTIAAGNHQSLLDVFLAAGFCHANNVSCRFLVNARYFSNPLAGRWLRRIGCIPLDKRTKDEAFAEAARSLERFELIGIMPEGRLTKPEERNPQVGPFRAGVAELARETDSIVRPITFHQSGLAWPRGKWPKLRLRNRPVVTMRLGGPINLHGSTDLENAKLIEDAVSALLTEVDNLTKAT